MMAWQSQRIVVVVLWPLLAIPVHAQPRIQVKAALPKVVLIGDSIRLGYAPRVTQLLKDRAEIVSHKANGGDSATVLKNLDAWVIRLNPDVVHLNCGLHDLKVGRESKLLQVDPGQYKANLREIVARIRAQTNADLVFAGTTPILDDRHARRGANFDRFEADVLRYNDAALGVMQSAGVVYHDLHWVVEQGGPAGLLGKDGTHYTPAGYERLAAAVADCVQRQLIVRKQRLAQRLSAPATTAADYLSAEKTRDANVPRAYKDMVHKELKVPNDLSEWQRMRAQLRHAVVQSLGKLPARPAPLKVQRVTREIRNGYTLEKVAIDNGVDGEITALVLIPNPRPKRAPAVLWLHSSTPDKTQIITPHSNGGALPLGEVLTRAGYVVMAPDAYWHGDRVGTGPSGALETDRAEQESLFKYNLWMGRTLWGMFVRDDQIALDYLCGRPEVDPMHIGATGMSMGSTRAWWLAAIDDRIAATVAVACLTRYQNLIAHGQLRQHGIYYFVNGLLNDCDTEGVIALNAPRPFLALTGELDAGSPADGVRVIEEKVGKVYTLNNGSNRFRSVLYPGVGHVYTPAMRQETLAWFDRWLKLGDRR